MRCLAAVSRVTISRVAMSRVKECGCGVGRYYEGRVRVNNAVGGVLED